MRTFDAEGLALATRAQLLEARSSKSLFAYRGGRHGALSCIYLIGGEAASGSSTIPPPSLKSRDVIRMYAERDGWTCHLCLGAIDPAARGAWSPSPDHLTPRSAGGSDYPSNIKTSHLSCNKSRRDRPLSTVALSESLTEPVVSHSVSYPVVTHDRKGREGKGIGREAACACFVGLLVRAADLWITPLASATAAFGSRVACDAFGGDSGWA